MTRSVAAAALVALSLLVPLGARAEDAPTGELAFVRKGDVYVIRSDGSGLRRLTRSRADEFSPAWSRDGSRLAFVSYRDGNAEIYSMRADGSGARRLTRHRSEDLTPAWSPDGRRIAFASNRTGEYELYVMDAGGTNVRRLTRLARPGNGSFSPAWSPDGRLIAFSSSARTPENPELYAIRPDGRGLRRLTRTAGDAHTLGDDAMPDWSPDGKRIVFTSNRTGDGELWAMNADGSRQRRLAGLRRRDDWEPSVSPDGGWIAFESRPAEGSDVYLVRADGTRLRSFLRNASQPTWRRAA